MTTPLHTLTSAFLLSASPWIVSGCGDSEKPPPVPPPASSTPASGEAKPAKTGYVEEDVADGGTIEGTVVYAGEAPAPTMHDVPSDKKKECGEKSPDQRRMLSVDNDTKGVRNAVVYLDKIAKGKRKPAGPIVLDQLQCVYMPHVILATTGAEVTFKNTDKAQHNVHVNAGKNDSFNSMIPPGNSQAWTPKFAEVDRISCDLHDWMESYVVVKEHPYVAVTDEKGKFRLSDVPPGEHTLKVWHEKLAPQPVDGGKAQVEGGKNAQAAITLQPK